MAEEVTISKAGGSTLVAAAAAGDVDALTRIVATHHDDMARIAFVICGERELAQDAVQTAWGQAWRKLGTLRDEARLRPWLMSIAANEARQLVRSRRRQAVVSIEVAEIGSDRFDPATRPATPDLGAALARLSAEDRQLLALRHVAGFDASEIGRLLGISASGVRSRLARLLARLRTELADA